MNLVERDERRWGRMPGRFLGSLLLATLVPGVAIAQGTSASSSFQGTENPLSENGAWVGLTSMSPQGTRFQKNNGAFPNQAVGPGNNHAGARTTVAVGDDHYSEIVVGHLDNTNSYVGPFVRIQPSGPAIDSGYMWWGAWRGESTTGSIASTRTEPATPRSASSSIRPSPTETDSVSSRAAP